MTKYNEICEWLSEVSPAQPQQPVQPQPDPPRLPLSSSPVSDQRWLEVEESAESAESELSSSSESDSTSSPAQKPVTLHLKGIINQRSFGGREAAPASLEEMSKHAKKAAFGIGILSPSDLGTMRANPRVNTGSLFKDVLEGSHFLDTTGQRELLGALPDVDTLINIWEEAQECSLGDHSDASWNCAVHYPLLQAALRLASANHPDAQQQNSFQIKALNVTTAKVATSYAVSATAQSYDRTADFCLCIQPHRSSLLDNELCRVALCSSHLSINHTDYAPLIKNPICLSIRTIRAGVDWQVALEEVSTWMAGHWRRLQELVGDSGALKRLEFLPGILVQGHDWNFIAATPAKAGDSASRGETMVWSKVLIGSTDGIQGICQIITFLQRLASWSAGTYWPWFESAVMRG